MKPAGDFVYKTRPEEDDRLDTTDPQTLLVLRRFLLQAQPKIVVEAGSFKGAFATMAADLVAGWGGFVVTTDPAHHDDWYATNYRDNLLYLQDDFTAIREDCPEIIGRVGFAYIDSGPAFLAPVNNATRYQHYCLAKEWLGPNGIIAVDDTNGDWDGVDIIRAESTMNLTEIGRGLTVRQCLTNVSTSAG